MTYRLGLRFFSLRFGELAFVNLLNSSVEVLLAFGKAFELVFDWGLCLHGGVLLRAATWLLLCLEELLGLLSLDEGDHMAVKHLNLRHQVNNL